MDMRMFSSKSLRRLMREPLKLGIASVAGGLLLLVVFVALFEPYMNPLSIVNLKILIPSLTPKVKGEGKLAEIAKKECDPKVGACAVDGASPVMKIDRPSLPVVTEEDDPPMNFSFQINLVPEKATRKTTCNISHPRTDVCVMEGNVRISGSPPTVDFGGDAGDWWRVKAYARKDDPAAMAHVREVLVREVDGHTRACQVNHSVPAVVFSSGGYVGNVYHGLSDVLLPLFITSRRFSGDVQFLVTDYKEWWIQRFKDVLGQLTNHDIIDLDSDDRVHCFPQATVGLTRHGEFSADPTLPPHDLTTRDFTAFLRTSLSLGRSSPTTPSLPGTRPRLLLIDRARTRRLVNLPEVAAAARRAGFDVVVGEGTDVALFAKIVNSCDVMVGVHGAGMTNMAFLPPGGVLVQIMPLGGLAEWAGWLCYGKPAAGMGLRHLMYRIEVEESTLLEIYPRNHTVFTDPRRYEKKGWRAFGKIYFDKQNVRVNVTRFEGVLRQAFDLLRQQ